MCHVVDDICACHLFCVTLSCSGDSQISVLVDVCM